MASPASVLATPVEACRAGPGSCSFGALAFLHGWALTCAHSNACPHFGGLSGLAMDPSSNGTALLAVGDRGSSFRFPSRPESRDSMWIAPLTGTNGQPLANHGGGAQTGLSQSAVVRSHAVFVSHLLLSLSLCSTLS